MTDRVLKFVPLHAPSTETLVERFLANQTPGTALVYRLAWKKLREFEPNEVTPERAYDFIHHLRAQKGQMHWRLGDKLSSATVRKEIGACRSIFQHLVDLGHVAHNPFKHPLVKAVKFRKSPKRQSQALTRKQVRAICDRPPVSTQKGIRDRAILAILFSCGARRMEVCRLAHADVELVGGIVKLRFAQTKNGEDREVPLPKWASERVIIWMQRSPARTFSSPLFWGKNPDKHISDTQVKDMVAEYGAQLGIKVTPHYARASVATELLRQGKSVKEVQQVTGHLSAGGVEFYDRREWNDENHPVHDVDWWGEESEESDG